MLLPSLINQDGSIFVRKKLRPIWEYLRISCHGTLCLLELNVSEKGTTISVSVGCLV